MTRTCTITVRHMGYDLAFDVSYHWDGKYRPATREQPEEYPTLEIDDCELVEWDGDVPTQEQCLIYGDGELIDPAELYSRLISADAEKYPEPSRDDVRYFGCERY